MSVMHYHMANEGFLPTDERIGNGFAQQYIGLRQQEGRLYSDREVAMLPEVARTNPHKQEWHLRKESCRRLVHYLSKKKKQLKILEVGCGNGWLCHQLSKVTGTTVVGLDINFLELQQATRVFSRQPNLSFFYGDIQSPVLQASRFDVIVFAASIQYFEPLNDVINNAFLHLKEGGEIHILDTHFYTAGEASLARQRSEMYFTKAGFPRMIGFYFHHAIESLSCYPYEILYNPHAIKNKLLNNKSPFYWIRLKV